MSDFKIGRWRGAVHHLNFVHIILLGSALLEPWAKNIIFQISSMTRRFNIKNEMRWEASHYGQNIQGKTSKKRKIRRCFRRRRFPKTKLLFVLAVIETVCESYKYSTEQNNANIECYFLIIPLRDASIRQEMGLWTLLLMSGSGEVDVSCKV